MTEQQKQPEHGEREQTERTATKSWDLTSSRPQQDVRATRLPQTHKLQVRTAAELFYCLATVCMGLKKHSLCTSTSYTSESLENRKKALFYMLIKALNVIGEHFLNSSPDILL